MALKQPLVAIALWAYVRVAAAETITWEATVEAGPGRALVGHGVRSYSPPADVVVQERKGVGGRPTWDQTLWLDEAFGVSLRSSRPSRIDGFGLFVTRRGDDNGFSWEWFDREEGVTFSRRQGPGRVSVSLVTGADGEDIRSIEFLDDVTLRYLDDMRKPPGTHTHEVMIRKGSVLRLAQ
jgi:hypothetical protein